MREVIIKYWYCLLPLIITSYFSVGYSHPDEHFQILEFAQFKLGNIAFENMPWEFQEKIRPSIQPTIVYVLISFWEKNIGTINPFYFMFFLRLLTAMLSLVSMLLLYAVFINQNRLAKMYFFFCTSLWFMPFVMVRYSSETWSAIFFAFGLYYLCRNSTKHINLFIASLFIGIAIVIRLQIAFAVFGVLLWFWFHRRYLTSLFFIFGICLILTLSLFLDFWFYDAPVCTFYRYFYFNIYKGVANSFGTYGIWYYPVLFVIHLFPFISIPILLCIGRYVFLNRYHIVTWIFISFFVIHTVIPHKEVRFLYPMFIFIPFFLTHSWDWIQKLVNQFHRTFKLILFVNCFLLILSSFKPADVLVYNMQVLSQDGKLKNNIYINSEARRYYFKKTFMSFYNTLDTMPSCRTKYSLGESSMVAKKIIDKNLIQNNIFRLFFLQKMGDNFEAFQWYNYDCNSNDIVPKN